MKEWIYLIIAGIFEIVWAVGLKFSNSTSLIPTTITLVAMALSMFFLSQALKTLPIGTAYAIWTGIGAAGTCLIGTLFLDEPKNISRIFYLLLIIAGVLGLKISHGK